MLTLLASIALTIATNQPVALPSCCPIVHTMTPAIVQMFNPKK